MILMWNEEDIQQQYNKVKWPKWNLHRSEFHFAWNHVNVNNKVTLHQSEILPRSEISNRFDFTSGLM